MSPRINLDVTIGILAAIVNAERPRLAMPTVASNNQLTMDQVSSIVTQHGWPDVDTMKESLAKLRGIAEARDAGPQAAIDESGQLVRIKISQLVPDPNNVREHIGDISDLVASIREIGLLQPPVVRRQGNQFVVVTGHRRRAALIAAREEYCDVLISQIRPDDVLVAMIVENTQRQDLDPIEEARALAQLAERENLTHRKLGERVGRSQPYVSGRLALLELSEEDQAAIRAGTMSIGRGTAVGRHSAGSHRPGAWGKASAAHLSASHRLASAVSIVCRQLGHSKHTPGYIGGIGCGACWEAVIRDDERTGLDRRRRAETAAPTASDPEPEEAHA